VIEDKYQRMIEGQVTQNQLLEDFKQGLYNQMKDLRESGG
jgi:hypothetical protein